MLLKEFKTSKLAILEEENKKKLNANRLELDTFGVGSQNSIPRPKWWFIVSKCENIVR